MRILIGVVFNTYKGGAIALDIPGIGVVESETIDGVVKGYSYIELTKKQLISLNNEIAKELMNGEENNLA
jgi:hypothetical protein